MGREETTLILCGLVLWGGLYALPDAALAKACERTAEHRARAAEQADRRAAPTREERYVERQTRRYSARYGRAVGRWVGLARRLGWPKRELPTLMKVIYRESRGNPRADSGYYVGLLQFSPAWVKTRTDWRRDARESLRRCLKSVREAGWRHWPTAR